MGATEVRQQVSGRRGEIFRHAQAQDTVAPLVTQHVMRLSVQGNNPAGVAQQLLALFGQLHLMRGAHQQGFTDHLLQSSHLLADGGLREMDPVGRTGKTGRFTHRHKAEQLLWRKHRLTIHFPTTWQSNISFPDSSDCCQSGNVKRCGFQMNRENNLLLAALVLAGLNMRPLMTSVSPLLEQLRQSIGLSPMAASLLPALPMMMMGVMALVSAPLMQRFSVRKLLTAGLGLLLLALVSRGFLSDGYGLVLSTVPGGAGIGIVQMAMPGLIRQRFGRRSAGVTGLWAAALMGGGGIGASRPLAVAE